MTSVWNIYANGDEYCSLGNSLKAMEKNAEHGGQPGVLAPVHVIQRPITVHYEDSDKPLRILNVDCAFKLHLK